ncbi:MAG: hypothetical protein WCI21_01585 [Alphaproteobacteria bacterium]
MPTFTVLRRVDAYVDCVARVRAETAAEAAELAEDDEGRYKWDEVGTQQFDARLFVTLDKDGWESGDTHHFPMRRGGLTGKSSGGLR